MTHTDPISDLLIRVKNAYMAHHRRVSVSHSRINEEIVKVLKQEKYIADYKKDTKNKQSVLDIELLYNNGEPAVTDLQRVSKPGLRRYVSQGKVPFVLNGLGTTILTTSYGIMTGQEARSKGIGGEIICNIW